MEHYDLDGTTIRTEIKRNECQLVRKVYLPCKIINHVRILDHHKIKPATSSFSACCDSKLLSYLLHLVSKVLIKVKNNIILYFKVIPQYCIAHPLAHAHEQNGGFFLYALARERDISSFSRKQAW